MKACCPVVEISPTDNELIGQFNSGNSNSMDLLVSKYYRQAYCYALGKLKNRDDAQDVCQEAFLRVCGSCASFDIERPFFPWFYSIVRNLCVDILYRRQFFALRSVSIDSIKERPCNDTPVTIYDKQEEKTILLSAIYRLKQSDREAIILYHVQELSYDQISTVLKIPIGSVMSRLYYARKKLSKLMEEEGFGIKELSVRRSYGYISSKVSGEL